MALHICKEPGRGRSVPPSLCGARALPCRFRTGHLMRSTPSVVLDGCAGPGWVRPAAGPAHCGMKGCPAAGPSGLGITRPGCLLPELPPGSPLRGRELVCFHVLRFTPEDPVPVEEIVPNRGENRCSGFAQNIRPAKCIKTGNYHITYDDVQ